MTDPYNTHLGDSVVTTENAHAKSQFLLKPELVSILSTLHKELEPERQRLLKDRRDRQDFYDAGNVPVYNRDMVAHRTTWEVAPIPKDLQQRRVEITGPVNNAKMVVKMLNPNKDGIRADTAMLDFEDSMKPSWDNVISGICNVRDVARETISYHDDKTDTEIKLNRLNHAKMMIRVRGLHLDESNIQIYGDTVSASLFDFVCTFYHTAILQLVSKVTPTYYVPKVEDYREAAWWDKLFTRTQELMHIPRGTVKATFLMETLPAAYQMEEILYEVRDHALGLNVGRWDKIFSDIKVLRNHPDRVMGDRADINMSCSWMKNYAKRLIKICHKHKAFAIGGMSAFTPGSDEGQIREQMDKVISDKQNEANLGHDGCWVSHPFFIGPALEQFTKKDQLDVLHETFKLEPELIPTGNGEITLNGIRTNVRVGIAYMKGWNDDIGCVAWEGMMEDLATLEISRAQIWQWIKHEAETVDGTHITKQIVEAVFEEELNKIVAEYPDEQLKYEIAAKQVQELFLQEEFSDFFSMKSDLVRK